jgi:HSP20 family molecular chaperone IbpA
MSATNHAIRVSIGRLTPDQAPPGVAAPGHTEHLTPLIDIHEGPEGLVLEADLPGVTDEALTVQLEDNVLSLYALAQRPAIEGAKIIHEECRPGALVRSFILSDEVDRTRIAAELKNGVLRIVMPRAERSQTRRIEVKSS